MSVRYGISLIPDPVFTARVYRVRQLVCGQYGSWAAEMHMLHLTLADYFQCTDDALPAVGAGLTQLAQRCRQRHSRFPLLNHGVSTFAGTNGHIHLDFSATANPDDRHLKELTTLHEDVIELLKQTEGALPDRCVAGFAISHEGFAGGPEKIVCTHVPAARRSGTEAGFRRQ